ncbi:mannosyl-3-phosphoglycerate synthase [Dehalococcoidales bacterium]|nr:mannosyl-3-phosphoglycerate synthase [Dehalococcoidales bacterium]
MRVESLRYTERFGAVRINDLQKVLELDSGKKSNTPRKEEIAVHKIEDEVIKDIEGKMAVVILIKDEKLKLFEGVISGIPHDCLIIVVSNSQRKRVDRFRMERDALAQFCHFTQRQALIFHQKDPYLAEGLAQAGYSDMLDERGIVKEGKSEGMVISILLAMLNKKEYIAFIDSDNYIPGAVWEYVKIYAAGFSLAQSPYVMVRVLWRYKPKISRGMYFKKWGRVSEITNKYMNALISEKIGFETEIIKTANAGEHAMTIKLAEILPYASGFAVEPQELISIFEGFGGILATANQAVAKEGIEIFQIETRNPHLHEERGRMHLREMLLSALSVIYHSALSSPKIKQQIQKGLIEEGILQPNEEIVKPYLVPSPRKINLQSFANFMKEHFPTYSVLKE